MTGELLDEYGALNGLWASGGVIGGRGDEIFCDLFELAGSALLGVDGFEMVADYVGGDDFDVAGEGVGVLLLEGAEDAEVVGTELEVGFLEEVVYGLFGCVAESAGGAQDDGGDKAVETADELLPGFGAAGCGAAAYQFLNRYGGGSLHCVHRCAESTFYRVFVVGRVTGPGYRLEVHATAQGLMQPWALEDRVQDFSGGCR
jgi:hypothetical protein